jgi:biopolymer transport protein ExbB
MGSSCRFLYCTPLGNVFAKPRAIGERLRGWQRQRRFVTVVHGRGPALNMESALHYARALSLALALLWCGLALLPPPAAAQEKPDQAGAKADDAAAKKGPQAKGFFEILFSGGPVGVVIMLALIGLSLTATYLVFDNILSLRKKDLLPEQLAADVRAALARGQIGEAEQACQGQPSLLGFVLNHGLTEAEVGWSETEKALEEALAEQAARLYRKVEYLSVIGSLAPMLGLLGTVTGMLMAFQTVATSQGKAGAADLAEGIYQALVTTVVGLIIAIPALGAFAVFRNRVDGLVAEAAYMVQHAFAPLKRRGVATPRAASAPPAPPPAPPRR